MMNIDKKDSINAKAKQLEGLLWALHDAIWYTPDGGGKLYTDAVWLAAELAESIKGETEANA